MRWLPGSLATSVRQPAGAAQLAWDNPLTRGIGWSWVASGGCELVTQRAATYTNGRTTIATRLGEAIDANSAMRVVTNRGRMPNSADEVTFAMVFTTNTIFANEQPMTGVQFGNAFAAGATSFNIPGYAGGDDVNFTGYQFPYYSGSQNLTAANVLQSNRSYVAIARYRRNSTQEIWLNGVLVASRVTGDFALALDFSATTSTIGKPFGGSCRADLLASSAWPRFLSDGEVASLSQNYFQIIATALRPLWAPTVSGVTVYRPGSDIIVNGWTATPGGTLASCIDDPTLDRADYITSPNLTDPVTLEWMSPMPTGSYEISIDADRTDTSGQLRIVCLDAGGTSVGVSSWQSLTNTATTYVLPVTTTGVSTQFRIEVQ